MVLARSSRHPAARRLPCALAAPAGGPSGPGPGGDRHRVRGGDAGVRRGRARAGGHRDLDQRGDHRELLRAARTGLAHSVEVWQDGALVGGLYGVALGGAFFGESMFHRETDASKVALVALVERLRSRGFMLLDTQWVTGTWSSSARSRFRGPTTCSGWTRVSSWTSRLSEDQWSDGWRAACQ